MRVLVTGGTGVVGRGAVLALLKAGHEVRLLSRGAVHDAEKWPDGVEAWAGDVGDPATLRHAADGCGAVVHLAGIVEENPPETTFPGVNVEGTGNILAEAERALVPRFVYISSLGADRGRSSYHRSKLAAEHLVKTFTGSWVVLRPGNVYGPGDDVISLLLRMVRALPAVPLVGDGEMRFQPVYYRDLGEAIAQSVERDDIAFRTLEVAGAEVTTMNDLLDRLDRITDRSPLRVPLPSFLVSAGTGFANLFGAPAPINESKLTMLLEENVVHEPGDNALASVFGIPATPLDEGLARLADELPEQLPGEGVGKLEHKCFWADIRDSIHGSRELLQVFRKRITGVMPIEFDAEPGSPREVREGVVLTAELPLRGHIQMRVVESGPKRVTFATLEGHPLAGVVQFTTEQIEEGVRFTVEVYARAASTFDLVALRTIGGLMQSINWELVVSRMVDMSRGNAPHGVQHQSETFEGEEAERVERWIDDLVSRRARVEVEKEIGEGRESLSRRSRVPASPRPPVTFE
jgi:NADH dehydrogenase